jgi:chromosome segregation ATPase
LRGLQVCSAKPTASCNHCRRQCLQTRDGYKSQLETLRDKITALSHDLSRHEDADADNAATLRQLRENIASLEDNLQNERTVAAKTAAERDQAQSDAKANAARAMQLEVDLRAQRAAAAEAAAMAEKAVQALQQVLLVGVESVETRYLLICRNRCSVFIGKCSCLIQPWCISACTRAVWSCSLPS